ncbi:phosphonate ABC transporter, permease protein PhnE [Sutcliffiella rhizosphaerae]|uniref:Phosphate-import permease protein PhnE n=1 Tax=Sutcliffiella rhizosphaerae TaxID=2880967 RepID=A0ABM8YKU0_9BACI|nr:phosphonate ABC transporter, permease protein PhnE [Sutcliffiella rhizosphaerae]CAG9620561.1 Phosphate-import permease protein PhnE [Sutcliffiella rhizosphaerae]
MKIEDNKVAPSLLPAKTKFRLTLIFAAVIGFYILSTVKTNATLGDLIKGLPNMFTVLFKFFPPNFNVFVHILNPLATTIQMAIIATTVAALLCIPLSLLAAQNVTTNKFLYTFVRTILNILRTIPDLVLAVIFVGLFGIGVLPGILALIIFSLGILAKLISETIESVDMNPMEAMSASGANTLQKIAFALVPQVLPQFVSFVLYVFEINIRASVVLGLVGAGGIGIVLSQQLKFYNYPNAMLIIIVIFAMVVIIEYISTKIREAIV